MVKGRTGKRLRIYVRRNILGFKRSKSNEYENTPLMRPLPAPPALSSSPLLLSQSPSPTSTDPTLRARN
ncbi:60S ribosomal protein L35a-1-like [Hordeum vulgare]|nr:60S ribosomal protein L35a-1-like [Hordeum vulgare]